MDARTGRVIKNEGVLIKPVHSEISSFCTKLTSITPAMVEQDGFSLKEACESLEGEYGSRELTWASYGAYDKQMLKEQCIKFGVKYPMSSQHINVKTFFADQHQLSRGVGMAGALKMLNVPLLGTRHRGVDDARNIAKIISHLLAK